MIWVNMNVIARSYQPDLLLLKKYKEEKGINSVLNLREESEISKELCQALDMEYYFLPVVDMGFPSVYQITQFKKILDMCHLPILIHCHAGIGRTGIFCAAYRIIFQGIGPEEAIRLTNLEAAQHVKLLEPQANFIRSLVQ